MIIYSSNTFIATYICYYSYIEQVQQAQFIHAQIPIYLKNSYSIWAKFSF
jgi:hypothetical protein